MVTIRFQGIKPIYGDGVMKITEMLRGAGASPDQIQLIWSKLMESRGTLQTRFNDALFENPDWKAELRGHVVGSAGWQAAMDRISPQVPVEVRYAPRSPGHGALSVHVGSGNLPIFDIQT